MLYLDDVVAHINGMLKAAESPASGECCIYRVPFHIRRLKEDAYTPRVVAIGPFHHRSHDHLLNMERHKLIFCKSLFQRTQTSPDTLVSYIRGVEQDFRRFYSDTLWICENSFEKVILLDSAFIIELFWRYYHGEWSQDDAFLTTRGVATTIRSDLLLLENQLPFTLLDSLYNHSFNFTSVTRGEIPSFTELTFKYFEDYNRSKLNAFDKITIKHFTDLIRTFHLQHPPEKRPLRKCEQVRHLPSATELVEVGVRVEVNNKISCLLDLEFSGRVLKIPRLILDDETEILFFIMVALELSHYPREAYITDYAVVWDFLINAGRDVDVLVRKGVLVNWLGDSDSVAKLFNGLLKNSTGLHFNCNYLRLCKDLNDYCKNPRHKLKATLMRDYCGTPWQTAASIAGILLLLLSLLQSVCSVLQVIQGSHK